MSMSKTNPVRTQTKSQAERLADAAAAVRQRVHINPGRPGEEFEIARAVLAAADAPSPPKWPSNEAVNAYHAAYLRAFGEPPCGIFERERDVLRAAMLADPIITTAIELAHDYGERGMNDSLAVGHALTIIGAVNEAGL